MVWKQIETDQKAPSGKRIGSSTIVELLKEPMLKSNSNPEKSNKSPFLDTFHYKISDNILD